MKEVFMTLTKEQKEKIEEINNMSHEHMCTLWRHAPSGHEFFDMKLPYHDVFYERLFTHFGGFTPEISKKIGW